MFPPLQPPFPDLAYSAKPDEKSIMTYVSCFYHAFEDPRFRFPQVNHAPPVQNGHGQPWPRRGSIPENRVTPVRQTLIAMPPPQLQPPPVVRESIKPMRDPREVRCRRLPWTDHRPLSPTRSPIRGLTSVHNN